MRKTKTTYDEAIAIFTTFYKRAPNFNEITGLWHRYANEWRHFDGFMDWIINNAE